MFLRSISILLSVTGIACSSTASDDTGELQYDPGVLLGTGEYEWEDLTDSGAVYVIFGPQGGYHLLGSVRTRGIEAGDNEDLTSTSNPTVQFSVIWDDEEFVMSGDITQGLDPVIDETATWTHEMIGRFAILDIVTDEDISGQNVDFTVKVTTSEGIQYTDTMELIVEPHPNNHIE